MSRSVRRTLVVAVLACCFSVGSVAPAASQAKVTNSDLLKMDQRILNKLDATNDLLKGVDGHVDQVLGTVDKLGNKVGQVLTTVTNLTTTLDGLKSDLSPLLGLLGCNLLGTCTSSTSSP